MSMKRFWMMMAIAICTVSIYAQRQATVHIVQRGETAEWIAEKYGVTVDELKVANNHFKRLLTGMEITIPGDDRADEAKMKAMDPFELQQYLQKKYQARQVQLKGEGAERYYELTLPGKYTPTETVVCNIQGKELVWSYDSVRTVRREGRLHFYDSRKFVALDGDVRLQMAGGGDHINTVTEMFTVLHHRDTHTKSLLDAGFNVLIPEGRYDFIMLPDMVASVPKAITVLRYVNGIPYVGLYSVQGTKLLDARFEVVMVRPDGKVITTAYGAEGLTVQQMTFDGAVCQVTGEPVYPAMMATKDENAEPKVVAQQGREDAGVKDEMTTEEMLQLARRNEARKKNVERLDTRRQKADPIPVQMTGQMGLMNMGDGQAFNQPQHQSDAHRKNMLLHNIKEYEKHIAENQRLLGNGAVTDMGYHQVIQRYQQMLLQAKAELRSMGVRVD